jgi:hypothetical protein
LPSPALRIGDFALRLFYLVMAFVGALLPFSQFVPWLMANGLALPYMIQLAFSHQISAFAWLDVLISGVVLLGFMLSDSRRLNIKRLWLPILGLCFIGVSFALPLYLWMREGRLRLDETS